jgi:hypothetical protein
MNDHTLIMAFWILKDGAPPIVTNIITTLCGIHISKAEEGCNDDDDENDTDIRNEAIEDPNDSDYHELQPQHPNSTINHPPRSRITRAS